MSRRAGVVEDPRGLGLQDHVCWAFDDAEEFLVRAGQFLEDGLDLGEEVWYVGVRDAAALEHEVRQLPGMDSALRRGRARAVSLEMAYSAGTVIDPLEQVLAYSAATERAVAAGFTGLRVAADATPLVRTPAQLDAFARYEHLIDRYMITAPFSAMCAYQRSLVGEPSIAALACMHPSASPDATAFWLHAATEGGCAAAIGGELDLASWALLEPALCRADLQAHDGELILDATGLTFIDHRSLLQLIGHAWRGGHRLVLRTTHPGPSRLIGALGSAHVRVEVPT